MFHFVCARTKPPSRSLAEHRTIQRESKIKKPTALRRLHGERVSQKLFTNLNHRPPLRPARKGIEKSRAAEGSVIFGTLSKQRRGTVASGACTRGFELIFIID